MASLVLFLSNLYIYKSMERFLGGNDFIQKILKFFHFPEKKFYGWPEQENQNRKKKNQNSVMLVSREPQDYHLNISATLYILEKSSTFIYLYQTSILNFLP